MFRFGRAEVIKKTTNDNTPVLIFALPYLNRSCFARSRAHTMNTFDVVHKMILASLLQRASHAVAKARFARFSQAGAPAI